VASKTNRSVLLLGAAALAVTQPGTPVVGNFPAQRPGAVLHRCEVRQVTGAGRCGTYEVWENRDTRTGRRIALNIVVIPARSATPARDPVFWLDGGPGAAATRIAPAAQSGFLAPLREDHDIVFVDQRGTGKSNGLWCDIGDNPDDLDRYFGKLLPLDEVRACRARLARIADLRLYTTPIAMDDLDEVRGALGYDKIDIVAASYGTNAAQVYLRRHGEHARTALLIGVATPGLKQPLPFAEGAQHALGYLYTDCTADSLCHGSFPDLHREFDEVLARFAHGPLPVTMIDPVTGRMRRVLLERESYVERLRLLLYTTTLARFVPFIIHRAYEGDFVPFETLALRYDPAAGLARGMYLAVTCAEGIPFISDSELVARSRDTFVGETRVRAHIAACREWPAGHVPPAFLQPVRSSVPVLMISGEVDGSTPPSLGQHALEFMPNGRQIRVRYYGHQLDSRCVWDIMRSFVERAAVGGLDTTCVPAIHRPPFATELPPGLLLR
jgi:pimeloyl-ACP methyl ester carboxylesterase